MAKLNVIIVTIVTMIVIEQLYITVGKSINMGETFKNYFIPASNRIITPPYGGEIRNYVHPSIVLPSIEKVIPFSVQ